MIHFILSGKGVFVIDGKEYHLTKKQAFYIPKGVVTLYYADKEDPWHYTWVEFDGECDWSFQFSREKPCFTPDEKILIQLKEMASALDAAEPCGLYLSSCAYRILSCLVPRLTYNYVDNIKQYIHLNFHRKLTVNELSDFFKLDRSYIFTIFKRVTGVSPNEYIINYKVDQACSLLTNTTLSIREISNSVGYEDQLSFSRMFKSKVNVSPRQYRKNETKNELKGKI